MSSCDINSQVGESDVVPCCRVSGTFLVPEPIKTVSAQKKLLVFSLGTKKHLLVLGCFFFYLDVTTVCHQWFCNKAVTKVGEAGGAIQTKGVFFFPRTCC